jgi:hypothetical protein
MKKFTLCILTSLLALIVLPATASFADSSTTELRSTNTPSLKSSKQAVVTTQAYQSHVWFHSIDIILSGDLNANGYYHRLQVEFDADTSKSYQAVFAEFTLLPRFGKERVYYTSSVFELFRQSADDWLAIDTVLDNRFAADDYLLTVRLFDANTGYMLAEISGFDNLSLNDLPLEDYARDSFIRSSSVTVSAGTTGILLLLALCLMFCQRFYHVKHRR